MGAVVRELYVFRQRGQPGEAVESAWFRRGIGMEGDRHAAGGERQTSLLAGETRDWMEKQTEPGLLLPPLQGKPDNGGNRYHPVKYGGSSGGGEGRYSASPGYGKKCFPECIYHEKGVFCRLSAGAVFLEVIRDGYVSVSDEIMKLGKKEEL